MSEKRREKLERWADMIGEIASECERRVGVVYGDLDYRTALAEDAVDARKIEAFLRSLHRREEDRGLRAETPHADAWLCEADWGDGRGWIRRLGLPSLSENKERNILDRALAFDTENKARGRLVPLYAHPPTESIKGRKGVDKWLGVRPSEQTDE